MVTEKPVRRWPTWGYCRVANWNCCAGVVVDAVWSESMEAPSALMRLQPQVSWSLRFEQTIAVLIALISTMGKTIDFGVEVIG